MKRTARIVIDTDPQVLTALRALVRSGMFGTTVEEAAEELLRQSLRTSEVNYWVVSNPQ